jgi:hypothetical protein
MSSLFENRIFKALVLWCGLWELCHLLLNLKTAFLGGKDFPPAPPEGWAAQAYLIFDGMVASDIVQAALCLVFVAAYLARRSWCFALGLVCLGSSAFNSFAFTYFIVGTGAWAPHAAEYWLIQLLWSPLLLLFLWMFRALCRVGADEATGARSLRAESARRETDAFGNA